MIVVSNSTPLISLSKIGKISLLQDMFGKVFIPSAVFNEVVVHGKRRPGWDLPGFIETKHLVNMMAVQVLQAQLDYGESEAIVLAKEMNADLLILDEKKARRIAQLNGITVIGTIGVLQKAKDKGILNSMKTCLDGMIKNGVWLDEKLYQFILKQNNE
jgi:predicted nucleic acid-binding protein